MKSTNIDNYKLIKAVAELFCENKYISSYDYQYNVFFEHGQFWLRVETECTEDTYSVVDAECSYCQGEVDYCFNCKCYNGIDFEMIDSIEF